jgi:hypothetical protein
MEHHPLHTETRYDDLVGTLSVNFRNSEDFNAFAARVAGVDLNRYQPIGLRVYVGHETMLTVYATEHTQAAAHRTNAGKVTVRKFKVGIPLEDLISSFRQLDFTLLAKGYTVDELEIKEQ